MAAVPTADASPPTPSLVVIEHLWRLLDAEGNRATRAEAAAAAAADQVAAAEFRATEAEWDSMMVEMGMLPPPGYDAGFAAGVAAERERLRQQVGSRLQPVLQRRRAEMLEELQQQQQQQRLQQLETMVVQQHQQLVGLLLEVQQLRRTSPHAPTTRSRSRSR
jgi:hypothetical protein